MWVTSLGLAGEAGIFASLPFYRMFSGVPNGPLRLSPPQVHAAVHNSGVKGLLPFLGTALLAASENFTSIDDSVTAELWFSPCHEVEVIFAYCT